MPPNIAFLLCIIFIFTVFRSDLKQKSNVSPALWVPLIWMIFCGSKYLSYWLHPQPVLTTETDYISGDPINRTFLIILIITGLFILFRREVDWSRLLKNNTWILILFLYMGLSILWSDFIDVSFKRWTRTMGDFIMVLVVLTEPAPFEALKSLIRRCAYVLLPLSVLFIKYFRDIGVEYTPDGLTEMWVGVTNHKNSLGALAMISGIYFLWNIIRTPRSRKIFIDILFLIMTLWLLAGSPTSDSKTAIFIFIIGSWILIGFAKSNLKYVKTYIFFTAVISLTLALLTELFLNNSLLNFVVASSERDMTFTGRIYLWTDLLKIASYHPILGAGYGSFWIGDLANNLWEKYSWKLVQGHNGYIDVYVELGLVGLFLMAGIIFSAFKNMRKLLSLNFEYGVLRMTFLIIILLHNFSESTLTKGTNLMWFLFLLVAVNIPDISQAHAIGKNNQDLKQHL